MTNIISKIKNLYTDIETNKKDHELSMHITISFFFQVQQNNKFKVRHTCNFNRTSEQHKYCLNKHYYREVNTHKDLLATINHDEQPLPSFPTFPTNVTAHHTTYEIIS